MNINTLRDNIRNAVHDDSTAQTWCTANYGRNHHVYVGTDTRKPPDPATEYPIVSVYPVEKQSGYDAEEIRHVIGLTCGIEDENMRTVAKANVVEFLGVTNLEAFRKLVETAAIGALDPEWYVADLRTEYETIEFFPCLLADMQMTIAIPLYTGDDPFA